MKKILSLVVGAGIVLSLGIAYAGEGGGVSGYSSEKMIRDDDLQRLNLDQDRSTVNQMQAEPGMEGSAAGGVREEPESTGSDIEPGRAPVEKSPAIPEEEETGKAPEKSGY